MTAAEIILLVVAAYAAIGFAFAIAFAIWGVGAIDPAARGTPLGFRLLVLPAATALWPLLATRWFRMSAERRSR